MLVLETDYKNTNKTSKPLIFQIIKTITTVNVIKFQTLFSFCSQIKCWLSGLELVRKANREDPDQIASSEA